MFHTPCICLAICSLRARRAHCAYRRDLSRINSAPTARHRRAPAAPAQRSAFGVPQRRALGAMVLSRKLQNNNMYIRQGFILPLHLPGAYEASGARRGCATLTLARKSEVAQVLKHFWVPLLHE